MRKNGITVCLYIIFIMYYYFIMLFESVQKYIYIKQLHVSALAISKIVVLIWFSVKQIIDCTREHSKFLCVVATRIAIFLLYFQTQKLQQHTRLLTTLLSEKYPGTAGSTLIGCWILLLTCVWVIHYFVVVTVLAMEEIWRC